MSKKENVKLTDFQIKTLKILKRGGLDGFGQLAGNGMAPYLSSARSMIKKGLTRSMERTGSYCLTAEGKKVLESL